MRALRSICWLAGLSAVSALLVACGGFDNSALTVTAVRGRVDALTTEESLVLFRQNPAVKQTPGDNGAFELRLRLDDFQRTASGAPLGELFVYAADGLTQRLSFKPKPGEVVELGEVKVESTPATVRLEVEAGSGASLLGGVVGVKGTNFYDRSLNAYNEFDVGLPSGCYTFYASVPTIGYQEQDACIQTGVFQEVEFHFGPDDDDRCAETGCEHGVCHADGRCVECLSDADCEAGEVCAENQCRDVP